MLFRPNPSSGVPIYLQLMEQVKDALATGAIRPGEPLPGIRPLAEELVINPNTVARAYQALEDEFTLAATTIDVRRARRASRNANAPICLHLGY